MVFVAFLVIVFLDDAAAAAAALGAGVFCAACFVVLAAAGAGVFAALDAWAAFVLCEADAVCEVGVLPAAARLPLALVAAAELAWPFLGLLLLWWRRRKK